MDTKKLRQKILDLAIRGKLVPQDPNDEPASVLLERIRAEKERLIAEGKIKRPKKSKASSSESHYQQLEPPFPIPDSWEWVTIADICSKIGSGSTPKGSNYSLDGIPFFRSQNVYNEGLVYTDIKYISEITHKSMISTEVIAGDLLLNITGGSLGRCTVVPDNFSRGNVSQHVCILRPLFVLPHFFHCLILSSYFKKAMNLTGSGREGLPKYNLEVMNFPLPPIEEQKRIVATVRTFMKILNLLDSSKASLCDEICKAKSKILDLAMQGKLVPQDPADESAADMLLRINPKAKIITDNPHYPQLPENWVLTNIETINEYQSITVNPTYNPTQAFELYSVPVFNTGCPEFLLGNEIGSTKQVVKKDDVLLCKINPHLNRVWEIVKDSEFSQVASSEWIVVRSSILNPSFMKYYFESRIFRKLLCSQVSGVGGSLTRAQPSIVKKYSIPIPPYVEQLRIVKAILSWNMVLDRISHSLN